jgi:hypothetical protein
MIYSLCAMPGEGKGITFVRIIWQTGCDMFGMSAFAYRFEASQIVMLIE